jgi:predicted nucleotidyltransferase
MARQRAEERERGRISCGPDPVFPRSQLAGAAAALATARPEVDAVYLFGSRARGDERASSDIDLPVLLDPHTPTDDRITLEAVYARFVEDRLGVATDVVILRPELSPGLLFDIFRVQTILFARDAERAQRVACQARAEYRDLLPRLERLRRRVRDDLRELTDGLERARRGAAGSATDLSAAPPSE